jgi:hypothetical protein
VPFQTLCARVDRVAPRAARAEAPPTAARPVRGELPGTVTVYCKLEGSDAGLRPGLTGHARVYRGRRPLGEVLAGRALRFLRTELWW